MIKRLPVKQGGEVDGILERLELNTVCREAHCPNRGECYASGTATFLIMGKVCTRNCRFCAVTKGKPDKLDAGEPERVGQAVRDMKLNYVVVTSVTRDDLADGGASHFAATVKAIKEASGAEVEVLTPDFQGDSGAVDTVVESGPAVFNHNVETVPGLYSDVRPMADYEQSLSVIEHASKRGMVTKSGIMVGLGETPKEVEAVLKDLREAGARIVTIGQYLSPGGKNLPVAEFIHPDIFARYERKAKELGFRGIASGPFVRSSYKAAELAGFRK